MSFNSNTKGVTCGTEIVYASPPMVFRQIRVDESVFICVDSSVDHCLSFVWNVLRLTASDYPFGILKPFLRAY